MVTIRTGVAPSWGYTPLSGPNTFAWRDPMVRSVGSYLIAFTCLLVACFPALAQEDGAAAVAAPAADMGVRELGFIVRQWALMDKIVLTDPQDKEAQDITFPAPEGEKVLAVWVDGALSVRRVGTIGLWPQSFACWPPGFVTPIAMADGLVRVASEEDAEAILAGAKWKYDPAADGFLQSIITPLSPEQTLHFLLIFRVPADAVVDGTWELGLMRHEALFEAH